MDRWVRETIRMEWTRTPEPAGEVQCTLRSRVPARISSTRSCSCNVP